MALARAGSRLARAGELTAAIESLRRAVALDPEFAEAHNNLANHHLSLGEYRWAEYHYRAAWAAKPEFDAAFSNLLILSLYAGGALRDEMLAKVAERFAPRGGVAAEPHPWRAKNPARLRLGYVSADLHARSPVPKFLAPLWRAHNRGRFEVFVYSNAASADAATARLAACCDAWRDISAMNDERAAALVRRDRIDILVDLAGHWSGNRLGLFALGPAPVQVSYLGYPDDTGLPQIGGRLSDPWADPPGNARMGANVIHLPCSYFCFKRPGGRQVPARQAPSRSGAPFTFGSFNYRPKMTPRTLACWAEILKRAPGSRLLLHRHDLDSPDVRRSILAEFARQGGEASRVAFEPGRRSEAAHLALYRQVDVALDTFPYHGATTTCEALWMGVPVITQAGSTHVSRVGASLLNAAGLGGLVAHSDGEYVELAAGMARDPAALFRARRGLRERLLASTVMAPERFAPLMEAALERLWNEARQQERAGAAQGAAV